MCNNGFFGGNCCWIIILILLICCCGCGGGCGCGNGCGCNNNCGGCGCCQRLTPAHPIAPQTAALRGGRLFRSGKRTPPVSSFHFQKTKKISHFRKTFASLTVP